MKTRKKCFNPLAMGMHKHALLLLLTSSITVSAQTIQKKIVISGETVDYVNENSFDLISLDESRVITTAPKPGKYEVTSWDVTSSSITKKGSLLINIAITGVRAAKLSNTRFANALVRNGKLTLEVYDINTTGTTPITVLLQS